MKNVKNLSKIFNKSFSTTQKKISNNFVNSINLKDIHKEDKNMNSILIYNIFLNFPFYIFTLLSNINIPYYNPEDLARLSLRTLTFIQATNSGINISSMITNTENEIKEKVLNLNNSELEEDDIKLTEKTLENNIILSIAPAILNFFFTQNLLNTSILTTNLIFMNFTGLILSNVMNVMIIYYKINKNTNLKYFRINFIFFIINTICILFLMKYSLNKKTLKRVNDEYRLEDLLTKEEFLKNENKLNEEEMMKLYEDLSVEEMRKIEQVFEDENE